MTLPDEKTETETLEHELPDTAEPFPTHMEDGHIVISARKVRSGGLGFETRKDELRFAAAAVGAILLLIAVAVVTAVAV